MALAFTCGSVTEWVVTRFGLKGEGVTASHDIIVVCDLIGCLGFFDCGLPDKLNNQFKPYNIEFICMIIFTTGYVF
jgi:hypothetical protein